MSKPIWRLRLQGYNAECMQNNGTPPVKQIRQDIVRLTTLTMSCQRKVPPFWDSPAEP